ncbi:unnamed protein product, partial [Closterium sp. Naga37s-1]
PAAVASSSGVSPPNRGERRPTRQVSFNELVRVRRIPRHFFSADMTAAAMDLVSGNDPTAGNDPRNDRTAGSATAGSASQGTAGWQSINGVHASSHASPASSATCQGPVEAESPGGRIGGRKGDSASAPAPAPARSSAHAAASAAQTQPRSAAPTSSPTPAPAPALVPTPPPWSSAGGAGGVRRVSRSGSWSSTGGSAAARNALPSGASDGSGRDGSSGGYRAVNMAARLGEAAERTEVLGRAMAGLLPELAFLRAAMAVMRAAAAARAAASLVAVAGMCLFSEKRVAEVRLGWVRLSDTPGAVASWNVRATMLHAWPRWQQRQEQ